MNILIVSCEAWRDTNNGGNVLSNIFSNLTDANIAQIYCSGELPQNLVCKKYFQISDSMLLTSQKGRRLDERYYRAGEGYHKKTMEENLKARIPPIFREASLLLREILWEMSQWKTHELNEFVLECKPDIIFAPCYSYFHVSKLALYVQKIAKCPMISYISDDNYSFKQFRFSPSFWINRIITRKWIRKLFFASSLIYTMTQMQKNEYEQIFRKPMKVLCKSAVFSEPLPKSSTPIRFIYAGGLYLNRWKVLCALADVIKRVNCQKLNVQLHIFSASKLSKRVVAKLNDKTQTFLHNQIPYDELMEAYRDSDVALHVESFDLKNRLMTRLSFSTKIIDCLSSGCAVLAVGPRSQAGIAYLKENDAAICINDLKDLEITIKELVRCPDKISVYSKKAYRLGVTKHNQQEISEQIRQDFLEIVKKRNP